MNKRQEAILEFISSHRTVSTSEIHDNISGYFPENYTRITIIRDVDFLIKNGFIKREGRARNVRYGLLNPLLEYVNVDNYFQNDCDDRVLKNYNFSFDVFNHLNQLFTDDELRRILSLNEKFLGNIKKITPTILKKEFERLTIEFSWKSSRIEGNTYSLLDTERLIRENVEASGHSKEESIMILNHKRALDHILQDSSYYGFVTLSKIEDLHRTLIDGLGVNTGFRSSPVGIVGTDYKPLDNIYQIKDSMTELTKIINLHQNPFEKAFVTILMISYIQPFEDGNKRTSRILANSILLANNYCPISYRSMDEVEYKKAVILFYEQNSVLYLKEMFIDQFEQAVGKYFN
ncbi:MAG: Fic family protein [Holosporales bacterium]|jgi:fido (protein-threonine AMPylation protein)|nr:Fic family protein [Holosporales bacterium]